MMARHMASIPPADWGADATDHLASDLPDVSPSRPVLARGPSGHTASMVDGGLEAML
jgi:hypothetical protein